MSNILTLKKNSNFYLNGELLVIDDVEDINQYMMQLLGFYITVEDGVTVEQLVHSVYGMKEFIKGYFSEDYEVIRAFATSSKLDRKYKAIKIHKYCRLESDEFMSEDEFLYTTPEVTFVESSEGEAGFNSLGKIPIEVDENIELTKDDVTLKMKTKFTLLDILTCIFDEMSYCLKSGSVVAI